MTFEELEKAVIAWANDRNLFDNPVPAAQLGKFFEEAAEMYQEFVKYNQAVFDTTMAPKEYFMESLIKECGDVLVTLILFAEMMGFDLEYALEEAYNKIKNRTGKTVNGVFIKDAEDVARDNGC